MHIINTVIEILQIKRNFKRTHRANVDIPTSISILKYFTTLLALWSLCDILTLFVFYNILLFDGGFHVFDRMITISYAELSTGRNTEFTDFDKLWMYIILDI